MEINKKTIILCLIALSTLFFPIYFIEERTKLYDITVGTFTAFITSLIFAIVSYLHERHIVLNNIYKYFSEIYYSLGLIKENLEKTIENEEFYTYKFKINYDQTLNINNMINLSQIDLCKLFFNSKLNKTIQKLSLYRYNKLSHLNNLINIQYQSIVNYEILLKDLKIKKIKNDDNTPLFENMLKQKKTKHEKLVKSSIVLYEFNINLMTELNAIIEELNKGYKHLPDWNTNKKIYDDMLNSEL